MSGLVKPKEYDWKDSNVSMIRSKEDRQSRKLAAKAERAWQGCEDFIGTRIWRIEKFEVKDWPKESYGKFYNGDSYIILHGEKDPDSNMIQFDVHFWIGKHSTQDEYGTAAFKTVELDSYLDDVAVQHREVEGYEDEEFLKYFHNNEVVIEDGGIDSGFNDVKDPDEKFSFGKMGLKHFKKIKVQYQEKGTSQKKEREAYDAVDVPCSKENFRCDGGHAVIFFEDRMVQIKGPNAKLDSIIPFNNWIAEQKERYPKAKFEVYDSLEQFLEDEIYEKAPGGFVNKMIRVITDKGYPQFHEVASGVQSFDQSLLDKTDVFLLETPGRLFVWIGEQTSSMEKQNALCYAQTYLKEKGQDPHVGVSCMRENSGKCPKSFKRAVTQSKGGSQDHRM